MQSWNQTLAIRHKLKSYRIYAPEDPLASQRMARGSFSLVQKCLEYWRNFIFATLWNWKGMLTTSTSFLHFPVKSWAPACDFKLDRKLSVLARPPILLLAAWWPCPPRPAPPFERVLASFNCFAPFALSFQSLYEACALLKELQLDLCCGRRCRTVSRTLQLCKILH